MRSTYEAASRYVLFSSVPYDELRAMARDCEADGYLSKAGGLDRLPIELARLVETALF